MKKLLILVGMLTAQLFISPLTNNTAFAASTYDDTYNTTTDLNLYNQECGGTDQDYSINRDGVIAFLKDNSIYGASFTNALLHGRYGISNYTRVGELSPGVYRNSLMVYWTTDDSLGISWNTPASGIHWATATGNITSVFLDAYSPPGSPCALRVINANGNAIVSSNAAGGAVYNYYIRTDNPNYPSGYAGTIVPFDSTQGYIHGNVQCANDQNIITNILVDANTGIDGEALIADDTMNGKNYSYYLTEDSDYRLVVICDGDSFYGPTVDVDHYNSYNWICTYIDSEPICAAS
jgi:hypothetical protein